MKEIVDLLISKKIVLKSLQEIDKSIIKTRKKIRIFSGIDEKSYYRVIFDIAQKSRVLVKHIEEYNELEKRLEVIENHAYKYKYLIIDAPFCSKAEKFAKESGWKILRGS